MAGYGPSGLGTARQGMAGKGRYEGAERPGRPPAVERTRLGTAPSRPGHSGRGSSLSRNLVVVWSQRGADGSLGVWRKRPPTNRGADRTDWWLVPPSHGRARSGEPQGLDLE